MVDNSKSPSATLSAVYHSPSGDQVFRHSTPLPQPGTGPVLDIQAKTRYLSDLRASTRILQEEVNKFLTAKMEEDKASAGLEDKTSSIKQKADDELEEENYGEETVEDES